MLLLSRLRSNLKVDDMIDFQLKLIMLRYNTGSNQKQNGETIQIIIN